MTIGIPSALLYYYDKDLWLIFFHKLRVKTIVSEKTTIQTIADGERLAPDEICLSMKIFLGHVESLINKCDYILIPRLYSIKNNEQVCTYFNSLYDLCSNTFKKEKLLNYNIDLTEGKTECLAFLHLGNTLGFSYIKSYKAYKYAKEQQLLIRNRKLDNQLKKLDSPNLKILLAGLSYNLHDSLLNGEILKFLQEKKITVIYSDLINKNIIDKESYELSTDIHWSFSKEVMASINYYKNKVDGIILFSTFPCGPFSLSNELVIRKIKKLPILNLIIENSNTTTGIITRLESFFDIIEARRKDYERIN